MKTGLASKPHVILGALLALSVGSFVGLSQPPQERRIGLVEDWSMRHVVFARSGPATTMMAVQRDPRAFFSWRKASLAAARFSHEPLPQRESAPEDEFFAFRGFRGRKLPPAMHVDWSISLGGQSTAPAMYPAKFSFDVNAAPSCANDFVVFPVNQAPDGTHATLVAFKNLYSGTVPANGICNRTPSASDAGVSATVLWSYAISSSIAAGVSTSPVLSVDGSSVAFVESVPGQQPHFHVLAGKSGDGVDSTNLQNAQLPKVLNTFTSSSPAIGSGTVTDLAFGAFSGGPGDTLSSPFVDYAADKAYVGDDQGNLVRIQNVFCPSCSGAPSIDATWGASGTVVVGPGSCAGTANSRLSGPVQDPVNGNVYVGCADGKLYGFSSSGNPLATPSLTVGDGSTHGGIVDPPIVDGINGFVYAVSGANGVVSGACGVGTCPVLVQAKTDFSSPRIANLGAAVGLDIHAGTFNDAYFSSATSGSWLIYVQGFNAAGTRQQLYGATFNATRGLTRGRPGNRLNLVASVLQPCSPITEFLGNGTDRLFVGVADRNRMDMFNITAGFPGGVSATAAETGGTSGIIVDNVSTQNQASSIYFARLGGSHAAVKLTQSALR